MCNGKLRASLRDCDRYTHGTDLFHAPTASRHDFRLVSAAFTHVVLARQPLVQGGILQQQLNICRKVGHDHSTSDPNTGVLEVRRSLSDL